MNIGDLVTVVPNIGFKSRSVGIVVGMMQDEISGYYMFEVIIDGESEWFDEIQLRLVSSHQGVCI